ncbi:MAG TPA: NAD-dependent epimerase/dehydratase family protein [Candidatus Dormibacteraeota bacterium]|nr:NAD-dependent epimerase/dehydratase family protein [Candidatus Dormibacteraeota bacterium]
MKALVTGGAGFIGSHLVDGLLAADHETDVIDDLSRGRREQVNPRARLIEQRIEDNALVDTVRDSRPDVIFHLAAQIDVRESMRDPLADARANVLGTVNLLQAARECGVPRVVFASSGGTVYGDTDVLPTPEDQPLEPESAYGAAKVSGELYGAMFQRIAGIDFVSLRLGNVYGPRQDPHGEAGVVAIFTSRLLRGEPTVVNGDGLQTRDYVHVDDVVRANLLAAESAFTGALNIGSGTATDVNELHRLIAAACGVTATPSHGPAKAGEQRRSLLSVDRARAELGWTPQVPLEQGLRQTADFFRGR